MLNVGNEQHRNQLIAEGRIIALQSDTPGLTEEDFVLSPNGSKVALVSASRLAELASNAAQEGFGILLKHGHDPCHGEPIGVSDPAKVQTLRVANHAATEIPLCCCGECGDTLLVKAIFQYNMTSLQLFREMEEQGAILDKNAMKGGAPPSKVVS